MRRLLLVTSALASISMAMPAFAQAADDETEARDDDAIVVTARKREENLIDVPVPMSVATEAQLKRDQVTNYNDLQRVTPALEVSQTAGGESNGGGRLRGLGTGVFNPSVQSSVALVVDQAPVGNMAFPLLYDLAQVEVLRGPQGTLFGQGASAGVINIRTKAPSTGALGLSGSIDFADKGTAGSEVGELIVSAAANIPVSEQAAFRIATQYKKESGLQRSVTTGKDNEIKDFGVRLRALLMPSERFTINLTGEYGKSKSDSQTFFAIAFAPNSIAPFGPPGATLGGVSTAAYLNPTGCALTVISPRVEEFCEPLPSSISTSIGIVSAVMDWEVSDALTITSVSSYRERSFKQFRRDFSRLNTEPSARQELTQEDLRGFSQELRGAISGDRFDLVVGGYYSDHQFSRVPMGTGPFNFGVNTAGDRIGFSVCTTTGTFCPVPTFFTRELTQNRTLAGFADATFKLAEQFEIFGGMRVTDYQNSTLIGVNTLSPVRTPTNPFKVSESNVSGRIGGSFRPNSDTNIYASFSRGYKPTAVGSRTIGGLFQLKPEESDAFEVGAKFGLGRFQMSANAFYTKITNFQSQTSIFVGTQLVSEPLNVPVVKSKGFELTALGEILPGLNINAGYQFNDVKFPTTVLNAAGVRVPYLGDDGLYIGGTQFLFSPKHKFTLSGEYSTALGESLEVFLNANLIYKSKVLLAARTDPRYRFPAHETINLGFGIRHPDNNWTASVFVRNLTKSREPTAYLANTFANQLDGGIRAWPVSGITARVVGVRAGFEF
jgi:outer membrane receptor protein involved in Fe transport